MHTATLTTLIQLLEDRKNAQPDDSYVASLYAQGTNAILQKVGEEAIELIIATKSGEKNAIIHEAADLLFHTLVLLIQQDMKPEQVIMQLKSRLGKSGLEEKATRSQSPSASPN